MCDRSNSVEMELLIPANLSHTGKARMKLVGVDECIAPVVKALNDGGIATVASCCGHGERPGVISLADGRELFVSNNYDEARQVDQILNRLRNRHEVGSV